MPHEQFHDDLIKALESSGRTTAGLGYFLSAENDKDPRTNEQWIRRLKTRLPAQLIDVISLLDSIGWQIQIVQRDSFVLPCHIVEAQNAGNQGL